jgi:hypothetical protein
MRDRSAGRGDHAVQRRGALGKLIVWECVASDHQASGLFPDKLTVHEGAWAFCRFNARADGHDWKATGGADLDVLLRHVGLSIVANDPATISSTSKP